jgi:histone-lysine N-methyltransferase ASH1L
MDFPISPASIPDTPAPAMDDSASEQPTASTPPTSVSDRADDPVDKQESSTRRSRRTRTSVNYNVQQLLESQVERPGPATASASTPRKRDASGLSGHTLVHRDDNDDDADEEPHEEEAPPTTEPDDTRGEEWEIPNYPSKGKAAATATAKKPQRRLNLNLKERAKHATSSLGKRTRDVFEAGKKKLGLAEERGPKSNLLKQLEMGPKGVLDELDLDAEFDPPPRPTKRAKTTKAPVSEMAEPAVAGPMQKTSAGDKVKKWQIHGLYAGQELQFDPSKPNAGKKLQKKRPLSSQEDVAEAVGEFKMKARKYLPLPMFGYLDEDKTRSFRIPYDVYAPCSQKNQEKPKDWHKLNKNRIVGDAKDLWEKDDNKMPSSLCVCQPPKNGEMGCGDDCLNRVMQYECDPRNCALGPENCSNRPFSELSKRIKKGGLFDVGVEVVKTQERGHGIRAARSFRPGQIIMEYTGEIITEDECQRRMREIYKDKSCYYLMEMERNLVLDGTKGSMARFINHSCAPNCEVRMMKVNGVPRLGVYAGDAGIMTGEELSYDYNFDNFGETRQKCYCGASSCRGYLGKRLNANELKKQIKEEQERKRKAQEEAQKAAAAEARRQKQTNDRGSNWRGWLSIDDPEVKAKLREEKRLKEEAEKSSSRAQRLAARRSSVGAPSKPPASPAKSKPAPKRRKTSHESIRAPVTTTTSAVEDESDEEIKVHVATQLSRHQIHRTTSTGSKFTEDLDMDELERPTSKASARPPSRASARSTLSKKTTFSVRRASREVSRDMIDDDDVIHAASGSRRSFAVEENAAAAGVGKKRSRLSEIPASDDAEDLLEEEEEDDDDEGEDAPEGDDGDEDVITLARNSLPGFARKRAGSVRDRVKQVVHGALGTGSKGWRQSTLRFPKLST